MNESVGYVNSSSRFKLYPFAAEAIRLIGSEGHLAVLVTNQSGVGRGFYTEELVEELHADIAGLDGAYYCPHRPSDGCECRKPKPGMLLRARDELDIDLNRSWIVGDTITDLEAGWAAGGRGALVRTGFGEGTFQHERETWSRQPDIVARDVFRALCTIFLGARFLKVSSRPHGERLLAVRAG